MSKRHLTGFFLVLILFLGHPFRAGASEPLLQLSEQNPRQGSLVSFRLNLKGCSPRVSLGSRSIPLFSKSEFHFGIIGIDLNEERSRRTLRVDPGTCSKKGFRPLKKSITIRSGNFDVQRLTLEDDDKVVLSQKALKRHRRESKRIDEALSRRTPVRHWTPGFHPPIPGNNFEEGNNFGSRRIINGHPRNPHSGEDYDADVGDTIFAVNHGQVVLTGDFFFSGKSIFIDHGHGLFSMYFHLSSLSVQDGEFVRKGSSIGRAGSSGRVTGPHLHLGIQWMENRIDPDELFFDVPELIRK